MKKTILALVLGAACVLAWTIVADVVYNNHVPLDQIQFHGLYPLSLGLSAVTACLIFDGNIRALHLKRCAWKYTLEKADTPVALYFKTDIGVFYALAYVAVGAFFYLSRTRRLESVSAAR